MLGRNSPLHIRQRRREALKEADLVILAGMLTVRSLLVVLGKWGSLKNVAHQQIFPNIMPSISN
jgi:hypothetical protein